VQSIVGHGTTFTIRLPLHPASETPNIISETPILLRVTGHRWASTGLIPIYWQAFFDTIGLNHNNFASVQALLQKLPWICDSTTKSIQRMTDKSIQSGMFPHALGQILSTSTVTIGKSWRNRAMQFKEGTGVYSFDGQHVGHVDRVVLNPISKQVTHIVVRKGILFTEDKIVPLGLIATANEERVSLREDAVKLQELPPFEETHYIPLDEADLRNVDYPEDTASAMYWCPPLGGTMGYPSYGYDYPPAYRTEIDQNIPEGTVALKEGARVLSDNNQHIGNVTRVFTELPGNRVTYFLMSEGIFFKEKKLIPVAWIREIQEGDIHLSVGTAVLDKLPEYEGA
jgi:uncharacterized protein YrrD